MSRKPNSECQIMVFRPTMEEFSDFSRYIMYMESQGAHRGGVAKIIPPKEWSPCKNYDNIDNLVIPAPISQVVTGQKGLYTQYNIQQKPMTVKEMRRLTNSDKYASPFHESYEDLERTYWKNITFNPPIYGADISGSLYDKDVDVWNIARLDTILDLVENDTGVKIEGVNTAYLYFGMWKTSFAWHTEDMDLYSINYVHFGAPKTWYSVPPEHGKRLERLATGFFPNSYSSCSAFLRHKMTLISPSVLRQYGIPFNKITQEAGEFMITFPYGYHSGFNHGYNCAESTNFASERWIKYGIASEKCSCSKDMVFINMDLFVKAFQPEKYECWKRKKYDVKLTYIDIPPVPDFTKKAVHWRSRLEEITKEHNFRCSLLSDESGNDDSSPSLPNSRKDLNKKLVPLTKVPHVRLNRTEISLHTLPPSSKSLKKQQPNLYCQSESSDLNSTFHGNVCQIQMGAVSSMASFPLLEQNDGEGSSQGALTLVDRIKMGRRNTLPLENTELDQIPPPNEDHNRYTKKMKGRSLFPPLPVRMKIFDEQPMPHKDGLVTESSDVKTELETIPLQNPLMIVPEISDLTTSASDPIEVSLPPKNILPKSGLSQRTVLNRPLKRRHPVSKKGPSKKSSPTVVLKDGSADSDSSADEESKNLNQVKKKPCRSKAKNDTHVEEEGYPTLWPRRRTSYKTERQYNATVAKLQPYCAVCSVFHPYYQKSSTSDSPPPALLELLQKDQPVAGNKTKPIIPETIFATTTDNPAPLATCEYLDEAGRSTLIQCKACKVQVHASCYGISKIEDPWTCDRCSFKAWIAQCCLCCMRGGALKPVNDGRQWAHILCAVAIPEVSFDDIPRRNGININSLRRARQKLKCTYCKRNKSQDWHTVGTCIQCCAGSCATSFHPTCAHAAGIKMEPGDWPLPVFVYCHRHSQQKDKATEMRSGRHLPEVSIGQKVYGKHRNGRFYPCDVKSQTSQTFHHVIFSDKSWSDNLFEQDIISHDFAVGPPKPGDSITVKWTDGKLYDAEYVSYKRHQMLMVEFEDGSCCPVKRQDAYTDLDEMPKRIRRKLSNATEMSKLDFLQSPKKDVNNKSFVSKRAAYNASRIKMLQVQAEDLSEIFTGSCDDALYVSK